MIRSEFERENSGDQQKVADDRILDWLTASNRISDYHRQVLASGFEGPFVFDDYLIYSRNESGPLQGCFQATHRPTGHPVRLFFCGGADKRAAKLWQRSSQLVADWSAVRRPFVWTLFEAVATKDYRLIVASQGSGKTMLEKVPPKGRLPWLQACQSIEHLALGLQSIHEQGLVHGRLSPAFVSLQKTGACQVIPPLDHVIAELSVANNREKPENPARYASPRLVDSNAKAIAGDDLFSLGQIAVRLITGTAPRLKATALEQRRNEIEPLDRLLAKYDVPVDLNELVRGLLTADVSETPRTTMAVISILKNILAGQSTVADLEREPKSLSIFASWLAQRNASTQIAGEKIQNEAEVTANDGVEADIVMPRHEFQVQIDVATLQTSSAIVVPVERVSGRRRSTSDSRRLAWVFGATIVFVAVASGLILANIGGDSSPDGIGDKMNQLANKSAESSGDKNDVPEPVAVVAPQLPASSTWFQQTIVDNSGIPWESPTAGQPLDVTRVPPAPEFLFAWHPARMLTDPSLNRIVQSLGPEFQALTENWETITSVPIARIDQMLISLHAAQGKYEVFVHAHLQQALDRQLLLAGAGELEQAASPGENMELYRGGAACICLLLNPDNPNQVTGILVGTGTTIDDSFVSGGLAACDRSLADLVARSDQDRDASVLFLNSALISEEGSRLFEGAFERVRRPLQLFFKEHVRAVMFSFHNDQGSYLELMTEQTVDLDAREMSDDLRTRLAGLQSQIAEVLTDVSDLPYWDRLQARFVPMLAELAAGTRVGNERDGVIANCWLPPSALHNLIAASELAISLGQVQGTPQGTAPIPQSLADLLATRRSLKVTNSPDLRILLEDLQNEVCADFPDLPFAFAIYLRGDDLRADGITQNQRPGTIDLVDKSLAEILTRIMVQANPDKDATGPDDPRCKLIWVVAPDPDDPENQTVFITTRAAAKFNQYDLPAPFAEQAERH